MSVAALTAQSSSCRLPMTGPQRRTTAACAAPNGPRAASSAASLAREWECRPAVS